MHRDPLDSGMTTAPGGFADYQLSCIDQVFCMDTQKGCQILEDLLYASEDWCGLSKFVLVFVSCIFC